MPYEQESFVVNWFQYKFSPYWDTLRKRLPKIPQRWHLPLVVVGLTAYAIFIRCIHLLNSGHYYMLSVDSYFFHWLAGKVMAGEELPVGALPGAVTGILHSGLTYPLAYIAKAAGYVFGISSADALNLVCKCLPLLLALVSILVIYLAASRICDRRMGLLSAFAWAAMIGTIAFSAAGYIDRDSLSVLLIMSGAFLFYLSKGWKFQVRGRDIGWLLAGLGILAIEGLLYLEWSFVGPILLLSALVVYFVVRLLMGYLDRLETEPSVLRRLTGALVDANGRVFGVIVLAHLALAAFDYNLVASWLSFAWNVPQWAQHQSQVAELQGIGTLDIPVYYNIFLIPMIFGFYLAWRRHHEGAIFFSCWLLIMLVFSLFAKRVMLYTATPACLLSGVGLAFFWDEMKQGGFQALKKTSVAILLCLAVFISFSFYAISSSITMAPDKDWQDALAYIRNDTQEDAAIMTQWSWGYWILDLGQRRPVADNGFYGWDYLRLNDIGTAYVTADPSEAAQILEKYDADYLIFSEVDRQFATTIMKWAGVGEKYKGLDGFPSDSLFERSLKGDFESGAGLEVVYRSSPDSEVVVLSLTQPAS